MNQTTCWVKIKTTNKERFFLRCRGLNIDILNTIEDKDSLEIKIKEKDLPKLSKIWFIKYELKEYTGIKSASLKVKENALFVVSILFGLLLFFFLSHIIISVQVIHSSKEIRILLETALEERGIKKNTWKKSYQEIQQIKKSILEEYQEELEWIEIEVEGMKYKVRVEERKLKQETKEKEACHLVAKKDGVIKELLYEKGQSMVNRNDFVHEGDLLVSGIIKKDEEEKNVVCATGKVYAEVWYQVSVSLPMSYQEQTRTGKMRYNIKLKNNAYNDFLLKSRVHPYFEESTFLFSLFQTKIFFVKQYETFLEEKRYEEKEALEIAMNQAEEKISQKLNDGEEIITKKILKKEEKNDIMNVEIFVSVKEDIATIQEFQRIKGDENGDSARGNP